MNSGESIGIASAIIALCALILTVWQAHQTSRHNRLSVSPRLTTWLDCSEDRGVYSVELMNNGIGPAVIKSFEMKVDGNEIQGKQAEQIDKAIKTLFPTQHYIQTVSYLDGGYVMAAKETRTLAALKFQLGSMPSEEEFRKQVSRTSLRIKFESIYGEAFEYKTEGMESTHTRLK